MKSKIARARGLARELTTWYQKKGSLVLHLEPGNEQGMLTDLTNQMMDLTLPELQLPNVYLAMK